MKRVWVPRQGFRLPGGVTARWAQARLARLGLVAVFVTSCALVPSTPPPRFTAVSELLAVGGVQVELVDPARLAGFPVSQDAAVATARAAHQERGPGEPEPEIGAVEVYAANVSVVARPKRGIAGGSHVAWLVALVNADDPAGAEVVIVDAINGAVVPYDSSPLGIDALPQR
jgi:hypothetical protein